MKSGGARPRLLLVGFVHRERLSLGDDAGEAVGADLYVICHVRPFYFGSRVVSREREA